MVVPHIGTAQTIKQRRYPQITQIMQTNSLREPKLAADDRRGTRMKFSLSSKSIRVIRVHPRRNLPANGMSFSVEDHPFKIKRPGWGEQQVEVLECFSKKKTLH